MTIEEMKYFQKSLRDNAERDRAHASELQAQATALEQSAMVIEQLLGKNAELEAQNSRLQQEVEAEKMRNTIQITHLEGNVIEKVDTFNYGGIDTTDAGERDRTRGYVRSTSNELLRQREPERLLASGE